METFVIGEVPIIYSQLNLCGLVASPTYPTIPHDVFTVSLPGSPSLIPKKRPILTHSKIPKKEKGPPPGQYQGPGSHLGGWRQTFNKGVTFQGIHLNTRS